MIKNDVLITIESVLRKEVPGRYEDEMVEFYLNIIPKYDNVYNIEMRSKMIEYRIKTKYKELTND